MGMQVQFPSAALWHQVLNGPPVSKDQGTRNPRGFTDLVDSQLLNQNAVAGLQPPPPRLRPVQQALSKDPKEKKDNRGRDGEPEDRSQRRGLDYSGGFHEPEGEEIPKPLIRQIWA